MNFCVGVLIPFTMSQNPISSGVGGASLCRTVAPIDFANRRISHFDVNRTTYKFYL